MLNVFRLEKMFGPSSNTPTAMQNQCKFMTKKILLLQIFFLHINDGSEHSGNEFPDSII